MKYSSLFFFLCPLFCLGQIQIGQDINGENSGDRSGTVSLSSSGETLAIGAYLNDGNGTDSGHVRVFKNISGVWTQIGDDIDGANAGDIAYISSISSDGTILAVSSVRNSSNGTWSGHVRVFENINESWIQIGNDLEGEAAQDQFGNGLAISSNGTLLAIGGKNNDSNGSNSGHVRVFENLNGEWTQIGEDIQGILPGDRLGSLDFSSNGNILAIGATGSDENGTNSGHVRVFENIDNIWLQIGENILGEDAFDFFGSQLSLSDNGKILAIASPNSSTNGFISGYVKIFENVNGIWIQKGATLFGDTDDFFGTTISISSNGSILAIGANGDNNGTGYVHIYQYIDGEWLQKGDTLFGDAQGNAFAEVSISNNGRILAIGAPGNDGNGTDSGHVRVFDLSTILSTDEISLEEDVVVYPNPASQTIQIQTSASTSIKEIVCYDSFGKIVFTTTSETLDLSNLSTGLYTLKIFTSNGIVIKKVVIE